MAIDRFKQGVKKRREERLRLLREKKALGVSGNQTPPHNIGKHHRFQRSKERPPQGGIYIPPFVLKAGLAFLLFVGVYWVTDTDHPQLHQAQHVIYEWMHHDMNVRQVMTWYEQHIGDMPAFLPEMIEREPVFAPFRNEGLYVAPLVQASIIRGFEHDLQTITMQVDEAGPVTSVQEGWVTYVGYQGGLDLTVIVDHGEGEEAWYGGLQEAVVDLHDWVDTGTVLGYTSEDQDTGSGQLSFGLKRGDAFIDPLDVIAFD